MLGKKIIGKQRKQTQRSAVFESVLRATSYFCLPLLWDTQTCVHVRAHTHTHARTQTHSHSRDVAVTRRSRQCEFSPRGSHEKMRQIDSHKAARTHIVTDVALEGKMFCLRESIWTTPTRANSRTLNLWPRLSDGGAAPRCEC